MTPTDEEQGGRTAQWQLATTLNIVYAQKAHTLSFL